MLDIKNTLIYFDYQGTEKEEILRNLSTLYRTSEGSLPMDRSFGLSHDYLDYPVPVAQNMLTLDIIEKTETYEPRVQVKEVIFESNVEGLLSPKVIIARSENYLIDEYGDD